MSDKAALIEPHIPALRRYAYALTRDRSSGDDLVQDCLERALSRWLLRHPGGDLRAWLFTILHNHYVSGLRQSRRRSAPDPLEDDRVGEAGGQEAALLRRDILQSLSALSDDQQSVLLLVGVEGLSYEQVGKVLGVPVGTVMSSRARDRLRGLLDGERGPQLRRVK
jgi:RNA polymerase sigma-70 factor (ECF subfamily)